MTGVQTCALPIFAIDSLEADPTLGITHPVAIDSGWQLGGSGYFEGSVVNSGVVSPGHSPGVLRFGGDFTTLSTTLIELGALPRANPGATVGADRHFRAPRLQRQRQPGGGLSCAKHDQSPVADFPAVAVRAVVHGRSVALGNAGNRRDVIADSGGNQHDARVHVLAVGQRDPESTGEALDGDRLDFPHLSGSRQTGGP